MATTSRSKSKKTASQEPVLRVTDLNSNMVNLDDVDINGLSEESRIIITILNTRFYEL